MSYISHIFLSHIYTISDITRVAKREQYHMSGAFVLICTSENVILYNSSINKKLILCYILNTILCVFAQFCREHNYR